MALKRRASLPVSVAVVTVMLVAGGWGALRFAREESDAPHAEKLAHQWERYAAAQTALADRVRSRGTISRREWERLLRPTGPHRWTRADDAELRSQHRERIAASKEAARAASTIDLDEVRRTGAVRRFCELLPKGGMLHVHPTGTLQQPTVARLLEAGNPEIGRSRLGYSRAFRRDELAFVDGYPEGARYRDLRPADSARFQALFRLPDGQSKFDRFAAVFPLVSMLRRLPEANAWQTICTDFFARAQAQRIRYVEWTMHVEPTLEAWRELAATARLAHERHGIVLRVNAAFDRNAPAEENVERFDRLTAFLDANATALVVGIDLSGTEAGRPALEAGQLLYSSAVADEKNATRLRRTFHAGTGDPRNFRDAILLKAERVGHATQAMSDGVALEFAARHRVAVEANLTSNVRLGYASSFAAHPFLDLLRLGLQVSLSTDDEGILDTTMSNEFALAISHTDISYAEVRQLVLNSIATSFAPAAEKERLLTALESDLREFEQSWRTHAAAESAATMQEQPSTWAARSN